MCNNTRIKVLVPTTIKVLVPTIKVLVPTTIKVLVPTTITRADSHYASSFRSVTVPSECCVFTLSVAFSHLPEQHVIGGLR